MVVTNTTEYVYPYSWNLVTRAFWNKYPNEKLNHVERVDVLSRYIEKTTGALHSARIVRCHQKNIPSWIESIIGKSAFVYEETICDPINKKMILKSRNLSYTNIAIVEEICTYEIHPDNSNHTKYTSKSTVHASIPLLSKKLESFSIKQGTETATKGLKAMEKICQDILHGTFTIPTVLCERANNKNNTQYVKDKI